MVTGRPSLLGHLKHTKEDTHPDKHYYRNKTSSRDHNHWNTGHTGSGVLTADRRRNGFISNTIDKEPEDGYGGSKSGRVRSKEYPVYQDGARVASGKKRKFSPVVWDRDEKQVRISSKNKIHVTSSVFSQPSPPTPSKGYGQLPDAIADARSKKCSADEQETSPVESLVSNGSDSAGLRNSLSESTVVTSPEQLTHGDAELEKMEEGEFVEEWNILKSKWASDSPRVASDASHSSPESGEFKREGSEGDGDVTSLSGEACRSVGPATGGEQSENELHSDKFTSASMGYLSSEDSDDDFDRNTTQAVEVPTCSKIGMIHGCRNVFEYERINKISEGTYGVVYKARDKKTGDIVALKKVKLGKDREGFPITALREINILASLQHPSIVEVKEVVADDFDGVYMVMEYVDHELKGFMDSMKHTFSQSEVKCLMIQLLEGLSYLHDNWVIHRDLKTSNLLLNKKGELKICDFGMARQYGSPLKPYTSLVVTLWYRAPEVLLGLKQYSTAIDMWSVGCIMAELLAKKPLFDGNTEVEQIQKIFKTLGTPNDSIWPGYSKLPGIKPYLVKQPYNSLRGKFPAATFTGSPVLTELGFDLLNKLLTYDPNKRITAEEALNHGWFQEAPLPAQYVKVCK